MSSILSRARPDILAMKGYSSARSLFKKKPGTVYLDANECSYEPYIGAGALSRYPDQQPQDLSDALCRLYDVSSKNMAFMRGADEAIDVLIRAFCVAGKDNIIICPPTFAMYAHSAALQGAVIKKTPLKKDFSLDVKGIIKTSDKNTKAIFICSPNNPTGNLADNSDIKELCRKFEKTALIVVDETYIEFAGEEHSLIGEIENYSNLVILRTLSKSYAAAGLRCGVAMARQDVIELMLKVLPPYPMPQPVIEAAMRIMQPKNLERLAQKRAEVLALRDKFLAEIKNLPDVLEIYPSVTNYVLMRVRDADDFTAKAKSAGIILRNQSHQPGLENCVRISMGTKEDMEMLLSALQGKAVSPAVGRTAMISRKTNETAIAVTVNLDATGPVRIDTGVPFYDHMVEQIAKHGGFSLVLECEGDLEIEAHHTVEDCAIALGAALKQALDDKRGIGRYGSCEMILPMDEAQARVALDLGGRFYLDFKGDFPDAYVGNKDNPMPVDMVEHVFRSLAENMQATLHIEVTGKNTHHMVEACFKGFARALRQAIRLEGSELPSTKGML